MTYEILTTRALVSDNRKTFRVGDEIKFNILNGENNYHDTYIGKIKEITDESITISKILINRTRVKENMTIMLKDIEKNSCKIFPIEEIF